MDAGNSFQFKVIAATGAMGYLIAANLAKKHNLSPMKWVWQKFHAVNGQTIKTFESISEFVRAGNNKVQTMLIIRNVLDSDIIIGNKDLRVLQVIHQQLPRTIFKLQAVKTESLNKIGEQLIREYPNMFTESLPPHPMSKGNHNGNYHDGCWQFIPIQSNRSHLCDGLTDSCQPG